MFSSRVGPRPLVNSVLVLLLATLWCYMRGYRAFYGDAQIYAFQAIAKIYASLTADLFLQHTSQDRYSIFPICYSMCIRVFGLRAATAALFFVFTGWLYIAAWKLAKAYGEERSAFVAVGVLMIATCDYGGSGVFHFSEGYLSARLPAEALIVTALACQAGRVMRLAIPIAIAAMFVHPLIALPGLLVLLALSVSNGMAVVCAVTMLGALAALSMTVSSHPAIANAFPIMDATWLMIVRERSQFLFPQLWSVHDWNINIRPLLLLTFTAVALNRQPLRAICLASILVGLTGLLLASLPAVVPPVALLVQGQAWRWDWIPGFLCLLMFPLSLKAASQAQGCGPLCVVLLIDAWVIPGDFGSGLVACALPLWMLRNRLGGRITEYLRWAAAVLGVASLLWTIYAGWSAGALLIAANKRELVTNLQSLAAVKLFAAGLLMLGVTLIARTGPRLLAGIGVLLIVAIGLRIPSTIHGRASFDIEENPADFTDWTRVIPPSSTVYVTPSRDAGAFVWFTLLRPNYLALDQSAGVTFSPLTALEVQRRSEVLRPLQPPTWQIKSGLRNAKAAPLDATLLQSICQDGQLGFVISKEDLSFPHIRHAVPGQWMDWNLYACSAVKT